MNAATHLPEILTAPEPGAGSSSGNGTADAAGSSGVHAAGWEQGEGLLPAGFCGAAAADEGVLLTPAERARRAAIALLDGIEADPPEVPDGGLPWGPPPPPPPPYKGDRNRHCVVVGSWAEVAPQTPGGWVTKYTWQHFSYVRWCPRAMWLYQISPLWRGVVWYARRCQGAHRGPWRRIRPDLPCRKEGAARVFANEPSRYPPYRTVAHC